MSGEYWSDTAAALTAEVNEMNAQQDRTWGPCCDTCSRRDCDGC